MKKRFFIYALLAIFMVSGFASCKAKHCVALDDTMEGYNPKKNKRKKGRQEGLYPSKKRKMR